MTPRPSTRLQEALDACRDARESRRDDVRDNLDLFSVSTQVDTAVESVTEHAGPVWKEHALEAVRKAAEANDFVVIDDVHPFLTETTLDLRALGGIMREAARRGWLERTDVYRKSDRPETHSRPLLVWRSRLCERVAPMDGAA